MSAQDWHQSIRPLRAWLDAYVVYLWVDRASDDYRAIPNPARDFAEPIRDAVRQAWGRDPVAIHFLDRPPKREYIISERRIREHRQKARRREPLESQKLFEYAKQECRTLYRDAGSQLVCGTHDDKIRKVLGIVISRAKDRLEKERFQCGFGRRHGPPPDEPPTRPDESVAVSRQEQPNQRSESIVPPISAQTLPSPENRSTTSPYIDRSELRAALESLPWLTAPDDDTHE